MSIPEGFPIANMHAPDSTSKAPYFIDSHLGPRIYGYSKNTSANPEYVEVSVRFSSTHTAPPKIWIAVKDILANCEGAYNETTLRKDTPEARGARLAASISKHEKEEDEVMRMTFGIDSPKAAASGGGSSTPAAEGAGAPARARSPEKKEEPKPRKDTELFEDLKTFSKGSANPVNTLFDIKTKGPAIRKELLSLIDSSDKDGKAHIQMLIAFIDKHSKSDGGAGGIRSTAPSTAGLDDEDMMITFELDRPPAAPDLDDEDMRITFGSDFPQAAASGGGGSTPAARGAGAPARAKTPEKKEEPKPPTDAELLKSIKGIFPAIMNAADINAKGAVLKSELRMQIAELKRQASSLESEEKKALGTATTVHKKGEMAKAQIYAGDAIRSSNLKKEILKNIQQLEGLIAYIERCGG